MNRKLSKWKRLALLAVLGLAACSPAGSPAAPTAGATAGEQPATLESPAAPAPTDSIPSPPATGIEVTTPAGLPTEAALETSPAEPVAACPVRGAELEASDPGSVQLASGKIQLVEFFAFW